MNRKYIIILIFSSILLLQACASNTKQLSAPVPVEDRSVVKNQSGTEKKPELPDLDAQKKEGALFNRSEKIRENTNKQPMVVALLADAEENLKSGNKAGAAATLERALRLEAKNAMLWHQLGLVRFEQKNWQQAINLAKKSNSLAAGDYTLQIANWKLIEQSSASAGDRNAAKLAADMAMKLEEIK
ncbi:MAG: tetratricopeptide (TPR) repeat protein [Planctomycetota bacterium]|jgi:tetratricopeptide (TPR) repeat protein